MTDRQIHALRPLSEEQRASTLDWFRRSLNESDAAYIGDSWSPTTGVRVTIAVIRQSAPVAESSPRPSKTTPDNQESRIVPIRWNVEAPQSQALATDADSADTHLRAEPAVSHLIDALHSIAGMTL